MAIAGAFAWGLTFVGVATNPWLMGLILSTTALGVVVPILKETGLSQTLFGQTILLATVVADFVTMFLISVLVAFILAARLGPLLRRIKPLRTAIEELSYATAQIKVRAAFSTLLIFVVLAEKLGIEIIVGAFLAGVIVSLLRTPEDREFAGHLEAIGFGFLIPIFFIMVGVDFNLPALLSSSEALASVPLLLAAAVIVKLAAAAVFRLNHSWREVLAAGVLLCPRLSLIIAAAAIAKNLGVIDDAVNAAVILVAVVTVTATPLTFMKILPTATRKVETAGVRDTTVAAS